MIDTTAYFLHHHQNRNCGILANPTPENLKQILKDNIFGTDIHYKSVHLTILSLQLLLCSMLTPRQIWTKLGQFNDLEQDGNIIERDFFDYLADNKFERDFDMVIGNPPFKELSKKEFLAYKDMLAEFEKNEKINLQIPLYQEALLFLSTSFLLLKKQTGRLCLIMKSVPFLYSGNEYNVHNANRIFRSLLFRRYNVTQIMDFTLIKKLFRANEETVVVFMENKPAQNDTVTHIVIRESKPVAEKSHFEITHYDFHEVPSFIAVTEPYVWKCNLLGGAQVLDVVSRLRKQQKPGDYISEGKKAGWDCGQGYKLGHESMEDTVKWIVGKNTVMDKSFKDNVVKERSVQTETCFETIPVDFQEIFTLPHLTMKKKNDNNILRLFDNETFEPNVAEQIVIDDVLNYYIEEFARGKDAVLHKTNANENDIKAFSKVYCDSLNRIYAENGRTYYLSKIIEGDAFYVCEYTFGTENDHIRELSEKDSGDLLNAWNPGHATQYCRIMRIYGENIIRIVKPKRLLFWLRSIALRDFSDTLDDALKETRNK